MTKIGLTGGIGSGKSVVAALLEVMGVPVYIADEESKRLTNTSPAIRQGLTALFGEDIYREGELDKKRLAALIFTDKEKLNQANAVIHPEVSRHFLDWVSRQTAPCCAIESAILFESGFDRQVDCTVMVSAPIDVRIARTIARDGASVASVTRRINSQMPDEEKQSRADSVICNDGRHALIPQVEALLSGILFCR